MKGHFQPLLTLLQRSGPLYYPALQLVVSVLQLLLYPFALSDVVSDAGNSRHRSRTIAHGTRTAAAEARQSMVPAGSETIR